MFLYKGPQNHVFFTPQLSVLYQLSPFPSSFIIYTPLNTPLTPYTCIFQHLPFHFPHIFPLSSVFSAALPDCSYRQMSKKTATWKTNRWVRRNGLNSPRQSIFCPSTVFPFPKSQSWAKSATIRHIRQGM